MASDKRISLKKVGIGAVKANIKLWGGDKVPYLNNTVNAISKWAVDPSSFMAEYKVDVSDQQKIKNALKRIEKSKNDVAKLETELMAIKGAYTDLIDKTSIKVLEIVCANANGFKTNVIYSVTPNLLKKLSLSSVKELNFMDVDRRLLQPQLITGYLGMVKQLRDMEIKALTHLNKINTVNRSLQQDRSMLTNIVDDFKKKKKKK